MGNIVVTGGTSGIGLALVRVLAAAGHTLDVLARRPEDAWREAAPDLADAVGYHRVDVTDLERAAALLLQVASSRGGLDGLVNNAGVMAFENAVDATADSIAAHLQTNLAAPMRLTASALEAMDDGGGCILNVASVAGLRASPKLAVYAASKAGLIHYTRSVAREVADRGIRVNAIAPGAVQTSLTNRVTFAMIERGIPLGGLQSVDEVAALALWLLSDAAASVTGAVYSIDGGMSL